MTEAHDGDLRHGFAFGLLGDPVEQLALALRHEVGGARALCLELGEPLADILHALVVLAPGHVADLLTLHDRRRMGLEALVRLVDPLQLLDGALDDLVALPLEDLHLVQDRLVLAVVGRGVEVRAQAFDPLVGGRLLDLEGMDARLQLLELRLELRLLSREERELALLGVEVCLRRGHARAKRADLAVDPMQRQKIVEKRHGEGKMLAGIAARFLGRSCDPRGASDSGNSPQQPVDHGAREERAVEDIEDAAHPGNHAA